MVDMDAELDHIDSAADYTVGNSAAVSAAGLVQDVRNAAGTVAPSGSAHQMNALVALDALEAQHAVDSHTHSDANAVASKMSVGKFARNPGEQHRMRRQGYRPTLTTPSADSIVANNSSLLTVTRVKTRRRRCCPPSCSLFEHTT
ncbi:hypothetical protein ACEPAG_8734 [Sanghuangporus baumii]